MVLDCNFIYSSVILILMTIKPTRSYTNIFAIESTEIIQNKGFSVKYSEQIQFKTCHSMLGFCIQETIKVLQTGR